MKIFLPSNCCKLLLSCLLLQSALPHVAGYVHVADRLGSRGLHKQKSHLSARMMETSGVPIATCKSFWQGRLAEVNDATSATFFKSKINSFESGLAGKDAAGVKAAYVTNMATLKSAMAALMVNQNDVSISASFDWDNFKSVKTANQKNLWSYREVLVSNTFAAAASLVKLGGQFKILSVSRDLESIKASHSSAEMSSVGSTTLSSDIDITVSAPSASKWIAVVEDLWLAAQWHHGPMKVDLYGDFTVIAVPGRSPVYLSSRFIRQVTMKKLLVSALVGVSRYYPTGAVPAAQLPVVTTMTSYIVNTFGLYTEVPSLLAKVATKAKTIFDLHSDHEKFREAYYLQLAQAETKRAELIRDLSESTTPDEAARTRHMELIGEISAAVARVNLYRDENYVVPSSVVHIVKVKQSKNGDGSAAILDGSRICPRTYLPQIAACAMSPFSLAVSAVESLGFLLEHMHKEEADGCTLSQGKYLERFVEAMEMSVFPLNTPVVKTITQVTPAFQTIKDLAKRITTLKKSRKEASPPNTAQDCGDDSAVDMMAALRSLLPPL